MRILELLTEYRNHFTATLFCEHCNSKQKLLNGYHDSNYHNKVLPKIYCRACGKNSYGDIKKEA